MLLNIIKGNKNAAEVANCVQEVFMSSEVTIKRDIGISVDIEIRGENEVFSLEGLKELEYYFDSHDIRIW